MKGKYDKALILIKLLKVEKGSDLDHNMCFTEIFVIVLCLNYFFKFIKTKCLNFLKYINKYSKAILLIVELVVIFVLPLIPVPIFYHDGHWDLINFICYYLINLIIFVLSFFLFFKESKKSDNILVFIPLFTIFFDFITSFIYSSIIGENTATLTKFKMDDLVLYLILFIIVAVGSWSLFYDEAKKWKIEFDRIEFTFVFLESILESCVWFVTIISIFNMKLSGLLLLLALYIEAYATFIYPVIEMGKYIREKELKQIIKKVILV